MANVFRESSLKQLQEVDKSDDYIMVARSSRWMIFVMLVLLALAGISLLSYYIINAESMYEATTDESLRGFISLFL